jgi:hypothetical protein
MFSTHNRYIGVTHGNATEANVGVWNPMSKMGDSPTTLLVLCEALAGFRGLRGHVVRHRQRTFPAWVAIRVGNFDLAQPMSMDSNRCTKLEETNLLGHQQQLQPRITIAIDFNSWCQIHHRCLPRVRSCGRTS